MSTRKVAIDAQRIFNSGQYYAIHRQFLRQTFCLGRQHVFVGPKATTLAQEPRLIRVRLDVMTIMPKIQYKARMSRFPFLRMRIAQHGPLFLSVLL